MEWNISYEEYKECRKIHGDFSSSDGDSDDCKLELDEEYEDLKPPPIQIDSNKHKIIKLTHSNDDWLLNEPKPKVKTFADALKTKKNAPQMSEEKKVKKTSKGKKEESDGKEISFIQAKKMSKHQKTKLERSLKRQRSNNAQNGEVNAKVPPQKDADCSKNKKEPKKKSQTKTITKENPSKDTSKQQIKPIQKQEDTPKKGLSKSQRRNRNRKLKKTLVTPPSASSDLVPYANTPPQTARSKQNPSAKRHLLEQIFHEKWFEEGPEFLPFMMWAPPRLIHHLQRRKPMITPPLVEVSMASIDAVNSLPLPPLPDQTQSLSMIIIEDLTRDRRHLYDEYSTDSFILFWQTYLNGSSFLFQNRPAITETESLRECQKYSYYSFDNFNSWQNFQVQYLEGSLSNLVPSTKTEDLDSKIEVLDDRGINATIKFLYALDFKDVKSLLKLLMLYVVAKQALISISYLILFYFDEVFLICILLYFSIVFVVKL